MSDRVSPFLELRGVVKRFPGVLANDHIDLTVEAGEIHALLGENGAGKSTLMQILYGLYHPDEGQVLWEGDVVEIRSPRDAIDLGIGMIHQDFMLIPPFTVVENVVLGLNQGRSEYVLDLRSAAERLTELSQRYGLQVDPLTRVKHLPVGVQQRVEILKLLYRDARLLILDEPTGVLTPQEAKGLFRVLRSLRDQGHSIIFITHKLHEVMEVSDRVTVLRDGKRISTEKTQNTTPRKLARMMVGREVIFGIEKSPSRRGAARLEIDNVFAVDESGQDKLRGINLTIHAGEIVGLAGVDGNGQSELAEALMNLRPVVRGRVLVEGEDVTHTSPAAHRAAGMTYIPADRRKVGSVGPLSISQNAILGDVWNFVRTGGFLIDDRRVNAYARQMMERYDVRAPNITFEAGKLSGGNLQKMVLGREVMRKPSVLIAEQPSRGLDVGATEYVQQQLLAERDRGAAILLISAELDEILNLSDRIAVIYQGEIMGMVDVQRGEVEAIGLMMAGTRRAELPEMGGSNA